MKNACKILAWVSAIVGTIFSICIAYKMGIRAEVLSYSGKVYASRDWMQTILYFAVSMLAVVILTVILNVLYMLLDNQEQILYNLNNVKSDTRPGLGESKADVSKGEWVCPKCGKKNYSYTGTCGCGYSKDS